MGNNVNGTLEGKLTTTSSQQASEATVTITNQNTGARRVLTTGGDDKFKVSLPAGTYDVVTTRPGYAASSLKGVEVRLGAMSSVVVPLSSKGDMEEIVVVGEASSAIQSGIAETALNISIEEVEMLPVSRTIEAVALLAPGTVLGDTAFGEDKKLVSFGGASVGENGYFIDGLNVTNFRNGLGGSSVPFEFYSQFQIKTGGYGAEFGRSLGGVLNAVVKKARMNSNTGSSLISNPKVADLQIRIPEEMMALFMI